MGDLNQLEIVRSHRRLVVGPILDVGSRDYGNTSDCRALFPDADYVGLDMSEGSNVDVVADLTGEFDPLDRALEGRRFGTVICFSVLEHCAEPFAMARNIERLMASQGVLFVSVPFAWKIHGYPDDYWRFTPQGVRRLFSAIDFDHHPGSISTSAQGEIRPIDPYRMRLDLNDHARAVRSGTYSELAARGIRFLQRRGWLSFLFKYPYVMPPVMVNLIGVKREPEPRDPARAQAERMTVAPP